MKLGKRKLLYTYTCGRYAGATSSHWHGSVITKIATGTRSEGNGLCMTLPRALLWLVTGR